MTFRRLPDNEHERLLLELLERERAAMIPKVSLGRFTGIADYVLREGEFFDVLESTDGPLALPGFCYANAYRFARRSNGTLQYGEGYALARRGPKKSASIINDWRRGFPLFK